MNLQNSQKIKSVILVPRPPIVVVMGHIDHGKSKLLDYIRKTNVAEKEAGGITQHIGAYEAEVKCDIAHEHKTRKITFLDTPGHEAFSQMRLRGAKIADAAILIIDAVEGIKPQTLEAHEAIQKAGIPFVIALNKIDKPGADPERVRAQLTEHQIFVEGYGGKIPAANISAKFGQGVDELLDIVLLLTEMENLRANPDENGSGYVIESKLGARRGISATLLIQNGVLKKGIFVVSGNAMAPVRILEDFQGRVLEEATFSSPVRLFGFDKMPEAGNEFASFVSKKEAEETIKTLGVKKETSGAASLGEISKEKIIIPVIIKTDVSGSLEALEQEIKKLENEEVFINILRRDAGKITEDDVKLASSAENAIIVGFNVSADSPAPLLAGRFKILIFTSDIIYKISEWLGEQIEKRKEKIQTEKIAGRAKTLKIFSRIKNKQLIGGEVLEGKIIAGKKNFLRITREGAETGAGRILELRRNKTEVNEALQGQQFGAMVESDTEIAPGDTIEIVEKLA